ncbi:hypothetical protein EIP86_011407 [Pleurotus ostreatoroseus]|nr:hypothetical protein EIP86_011407 [Pleurotus ostreatoroseus]
MLALRLTRPRLSISPVRRAVHAWSPAAPSSLQLALPERHSTTVRRAGNPAPGAFADTQSSLYGNQALYGQLLVSALLRTSGESPNPGSPPPPEPPQDSDWISDQEWEIRTGRAVYILQQTLPDYFQTGLVSSLDIPEIRLDSDKSAEKKSSGWSIKSALGLSDIADTIKPASSTNGKDASKRDDKDKDSTDSIYSPRVRLSYTPPIPLPAPFPKTLHVEGLHLYIASSTARHSDKKSSHRASREKSLVLGLTVHGASRVSKTPAQWDVNCTYTFSPISGLILQHSIDSIEPAPTQALFEALGKFGLLGPGAGRGGAPGVGS